MAKFVPNTPEINRLLNQPGGMVPNFVNGFGRQVEKAAQGKAPVDTGKMRAAFRTTSKYGPSGLTLTIENTSDHAMVIHQGHKKMVAPTPGGKSYYKFQPKDIRGSKYFVRTKEVRAVGGVPFLTAALNQINDQLGTDRFKVTITLKPRTDPPPRGRSLTP